MATGLMTTPETPARDAPDPRRWTALAVLAVVQFMLVLDITVVNVALPSIKTDLGFSQSGLAWVVNAYTLMAGGLLLLGGRLSDIVGRRRLFLVGVSVFALASLTCGLAVHPAMLVGSRFIQGAGEALAAPAALGLVALLFPDPKERVKALGMWGGIAGLGGTTGTVISGALTGLATWRLVFLVNLPVAAFALVMVPRLVSESRMDRIHTDARRRLDFWGPFTATAGMIAIVDGLLQAATDPWGSVSVALPLAGGVALLGAFVLIEARVAHPLIPLRFFTNRTRVVTNTVSLFFSSAFFTYFFLLTLYLQQVMGLSPLRAGLAYVPFGLGIGAGIGVGTALMPRTGVKPLLAAGFLGCAGGLLLTSMVTPQSGYAGGVLPGMLVLAFFSGISFPAIGNASLHEVTRQDASLASGVQNAVQNVGGAIGLACLVAFALRYTADHVSLGESLPVAATNGYALAFRIGVALLVIGSVLVAVLLERVRTDASAAGAAEAGVDLLEPQPQIA
jgi:EmrB/QacA subfamily drug resistance transporter